MLSHSPVPSPAAVSGVPDSVTAANAVCSAAGPLIKREFPGASRRLIGEVTHHGHVYRVVTLFDQRAVLILGNGSQWRLADPDIAAQVLAGLDAPAVT